MHSDNSFSGHLVVWCLLVKLTLTRLESEVLIFPRQYLQISDFSKWLVNRKKKKREKRKISHVHVSREVCFNYVTDKY